MAVLENATKNPKNIALFGFNPKRSPSNVIAIVVRNTWSAPPIRAYRLIAENFSMENSSPMINSRKTTPSSERVEIMLVSLIA